MKPFETVKFMETQMLSTLPEAKTQTNCCLRQDQFNEANYNYRKLFLYLIMGFTSGKTNRIGPLEQPWCVY